MLMSKFMKTFLTLFVLFCSSSVFSYPDDFMMKLMDSKVDRLTFGIYQCDLRIEKDANNVAYWTDSIQDNKVNFASCEYNYERNEIILRIFFKNKISQNQCKDFIQQFKTSYNFNKTEDGSATTFYTQYFGPNGFEDALSNQTNKKISNYMYYWVGSYTTAGSTVVVCQSKVVSNEPVLFR